jgi:2-polyprenyl-3-methyl-5-hydroxy-6-metoxy-1,4-benzoquinol methylase
MLDRSVILRRMWQVTVEELARNHYEKDLIAQIYGQWRDLLPAEETLLDVYRDRVANQRVLDLGCGGGGRPPGCTRWPRTTSGSTILRG